MYRLAYHISQSYDNNEEWFGSNSMFLMVHILQFNDVTFWREGSILYTSKFGWTSKGVIHGKKNEICASSQIEI